MTAGETAAPEALSVGELLNANAALQSRLDLQRRLEDGLQELQELGPVADLIEQAPAVAARVLGFDRVVLSRIDDARLVAEAVYAADVDAAALLEQLKAAPVRIEYPLLEGEVLRRRRPQLVRVDETELQGRAANVSILRWKEFVICPALLEGRTIGFLHGDRTGVDHPIQEAEVDALRLFAMGFALIYERAVLRRRLRVQRREMRQIASWADAKTSELSERAIDLTTDRETDTVADPSTAPDTALRDLLTRREVDVLELMVKGETNAGIARALVVSEGTIKFHVKNILRRLHASNRAEATSRYLRLTLGRSGGDGRAWPD